MDSALARKMANNLKIGESVYVPCSKVPELQSSGVALDRCTIVEIEGRKVKVETKRREVSDWIGTSLVHKDVGILVVNIGDFMSEPVLLDPLAKSVGQFCRLLVPDDQVRQIRVRSLAELEKFWKENQAVYSHVVWIAHGSPSGITFGVDGSVSPDELCDKLRVHGAPKKVYISLCCKTGYKSFGSRVSKAAICSHFIGPFHTVDGAAASQFCQSFLAYHPGPLMDKT